MKKLHLLYGGWYTSKWKNTGAVQWCSNANAKAGQIKGPAIIRKSLNEHLNILDQRFPGSRDSGCVLWVGDAGCWNSGSWSPVCSPKAPQVVSFSTFHLSFSSLTLSPTSSWPYHESLLTVALTHINCRHTGSEKIKMETDPDRNTAVEIGQKVKIKKK